MEICYILIRIENVSFKIQKMKPGWQCATNNTWAVEAEGREVHAIPSYVVSLRTGLPEILSQRTKQRGP